MGTKPVDSMGTEELMEALHGAVTRQLLTAMQSNPSAQQIQAAIRFLADNNCTLNLAKSKDKPEDVSRELFKIPTLTKKDLMYEYEALGTATIGVQRLSSIPD